MGPKIDRSTSPNDIRIEPSPIIAPGVVKVYDSETGDFKRTEYDERVFDINGDEVFDDDDDDY